MYAIINIVKKIESVHNGKVGYTHFVLMRNEKVEGKMVRNAMTRAEQTLNLNGD